MTSTLGGNGGGVENTKKRFLTQHPLFNLAELLPNLGPVTPISFK